MTTISGVSPSALQSYTTSATKAASPDTNATPSASRFSGVDAFIPSSTNTATPLTYNAAGQFSASQQANTVPPPAQQTSAQAAHQAVLAAENVVTQTLNSLASGSSSNSSNSDTSSLFNLPGTSSSNQAAPTPATSSNSSSNNAQNAIVSAQNAVTDTLNTLASGFSSNAPSAGL